MSAQFTLMRWSRFILTLLAGFTLLSAGCNGGLEFRKQTIVLAFPPKSAELRALLLYEDLGVSATKKNEARDLEQAKTELAELAAGNVFFTGFRFLKFPLKRVAGAKLTQREENELKLLQKHLSSAKGAFFAGHDGRISCAQYLTVRDPNGLLAVLNEHISAAFKEKVSGGNIEAGSVWDEESLRLVKQAVEAGHVWLKLEPGRLSFTMPGTLKFFTNIKREIIRDQTKGPLLDLAELPWSLDLRRQHMTFSLGMGDGAAIRLAIGKPGKSPMTQLDRELFSHSRRLEVEFRKDADAESMIAEFLARDGKQ